MKIAVDIRSLTTPYKTGVAVVTESLVRALAAQSPQDEFFLFATGTEETLMNIPAFHESNLTVVPLSIPNKLASILWLLPFGPTMDHFLPTPVDQWLFPSAHLLKTQRLYSVIFHDATLRTVPGFFTLKDHLRAKISNEDRIFKNAQHIIAVSHHSKKDAIEYYKIPPEKIIVTNLGVDRSVFLSREQPSDKAYRATYDLNRPYLLALATKEPRKNLDSVIIAYSLFRKHSSSTIPLVIAGSRGWKTKRIDAALASSPYQSDIHEISYIPEKHKPALYRGATAFLFPSFAEGFGLPVLEAMACGTPVITSVSSSLPDLVKDAAILIDPTNITDLVQALHQLIDAPDAPKLQQVLRSRGIERAKDFSWTAMADLVLHHTFPRN